MEGGGGGGNGPGATATAATPQDSQVSPSKRKISNINNNNTDKLGGKELELDPKKPAPGEVLFKFILLNLLMETKLAHPS